MCGRSSITKSQKELEERFGSTFYSDEILKWDPNYNLYPTQDSPVITNDDPEHIQMFRWGLIPAWAKDESIGNKMINARMETLLEKPSFKGLVKRRRCLVISDGFYEWRKTESGKIPYRIAMKNEDAFAFAGLWDTWEKDGAKLHTFTIITMEPNPLMAHIHNRMPAIMLKEEERHWLDDSISTEDIMSVLKPYPDDQMKAYPISKLVNSPGNNVPEILKEEEYDGVEAYH